MDLLTLSDVINDVGQKLIFLEYGHVTHLNKGNCEWKYHKSVLLNINLLTLHLVSYLAIIYLFFCCEYILITDYAFS